MTVCTWLWSILPTFRSTIRPSTYSRSASGKLVRRYSSTDTSVVVPITLLLHRRPAHSLHHLVNRVHDVVFHFLVIRPRQTVVNHAVTGFVAALFEHAKRGYVRHHVVRIRGHDDSLRSVFALDAQIVIHHHFAA